MCINRKFFRPAIISVKSGYETLANCCAKTAFILIVICAGCRERESEDKTSGNILRVQVTAEPALVTSMVQRIEITGDVRPKASVLLAPKVAGRLERLALEDQGRIEPIVEGMAVKRGCVVAHIDAAFYEARLKQAQGAFAMADAPYQDALREEKRALALFQEGAASEQMRDRAVTARAVAEAARVQAEAALTLATIEFKESSPVSPIDGVVARKHLDEGNLVAVGMPLLTIEDVSSLKIVASVPERYLPLIGALRTKARIFPYLSSGSHMDVLASRVFPSIDPATRTGTVEIDIENNEGNLRPGGFVRVLVDLTVIENAITVPTSSLVAEGNQTTVFVAEGRIAKRRSIVLGLRDTDRCQILEGVKAGEMVLSSGIQNLADGAPIEVEGKAKGITR